MSLTSWTVKFWPINPGTEFAMSNKSLSTPKPSQSLQNGKSSGQLMLTELSVLITSPEEMEKAPSPSVA